VTLPVPNLDDRRFQDIVDEAKRLIPKYCPEWTNHNVSDPGVALIELFAWMTEMTLFRLNQVPDAFYTHMLNLVGFERFPAGASQADVTFWLVGPVDQPVVVPVGTEVATSGQIGAAKVFRTVADLRITQPTLMASLTSEGPTSYRDVWNELRLARSSVTCFTRTQNVPNKGIRPVPGDAFYLGFEESLAGLALQLDIQAQIEGTGVNPKHPPLRWEIWQGEGWAEVARPADRDTTGGLNKDGSIVLLVPGRHEPLTLSGTRAYWLRVVLLPTRPDDPTYEQSPQLRSVQVSAIGGTARAEHSEIIGGEIIGRSTGRRDQVHRVSQAPLLPRDPEQEFVRIVLPDGTVEDWEEVVDFLESGPEDRHVMWNSTTGEVTFGPAITYPPDRRHPNGAVREHGAVPPEGAQVMVTGYRIGGGEMGNVPAGAINALRTTVPYVARVENLTPATGGIDPESVENAKRRGPQQLRAGARAVTAPDYERLASAADPNIARVHCLPPSDVGGPIRLLLVPNVDLEPADMVLDDFALPAEMVRSVHKYLAPRRILGTSVEIGTPYYQGVTVAALITAVPTRPQRLIRERALDVLYRFLNPLRGGADGEGWPFETNLSAAVIGQLLQAVEGVERVEDVMLFEYDLRNGRRVGVGKEIVKLESNSLFLGAKHQVVVR
jgi:predicted phage baseplate assembly protein